MSLHHLQYRIKDCLGLWGCLTEKIQKKKTSDGYVSLEKLYRNNRKALTYNRRIKTYYINLLYIYVKKQVDFGIWTVTAFLCFYSRGS